MKESISPITHYFSNRVDESCINSHLLILISYIPNAENLSEGGMLIASKVYIEKPQFITKEAQEENNVPEQFLANRLTNIELKPTICATSIPMPGNRMGVRMVVKLTKSQSARGLRTQKLVLVPVVSRRGENDSRGGTICEKD